MGASETAVLSPLPPSYPRRALTVDDVMRMVQAGVLDESERIELIEGELIEMAPIGGPHLMTVNRLNHELVRAVGDAAVVSVQNSLALRPRSLPQPDFVLLAPSMLNRPVVPEPADVLLVIEVADSSLARDRDVKAPLYARHGIREYWVIDLGDKIVHVHRRPGANGYAETWRRGAGATLAPEALPGVAVDLAALFA